LCLPFIFFLSSGLWDVMTNQQACDFVVKEIKKRRAHEPLEDVCQKLADKAFSLGSEDNVTVVIVFFANHQLPFKQ
jgi:serine/threonine protein phosphatase PrpC